MLACISIKEIPLVIPTIFISVFLYVAGLMLNDYCDIKTDMEERPLRPLPSNKINPRNVIFVIILLFAVSFLWAIIIGLSKNILMPIVVLSLILLIVFYNVSARKIPVLGFCVMGFCRGFNLLLGASIGTNPLSSVCLYGAALEFLYVASISAFAYYETRTTTPVFIYYLPLLSLFAFIPFVFINGLSILALLFFLIILFWIAYVMISRISYEEKTGILIRILILIQIMFICVGESNKLGLDSLITITLLLIFLWLSSVIGKYFYGS